MLFKMRVAFAVAAAVVLLLWVVRGAALTPVRAGKNESLAVVLTVTGAAPGLEHTVDGLLWLRQNGTLRARLILRDAGMDENTRRLAELLEKKGCIELILEQNRDM